MGSCAIAALITTPAPSPASQRTAALLGDTAHIDPAQPFHVPGADLLVRERHQRDPSLTVAQRQSVALECDQDAASDRRVEQLTPGKYRLKGIAGYCHDEIG